jgi:hypothetical protein
MLEGARCTTGYAPHALGHPYALTPYWRFGTYLPAHCMEKDTEKPYINLTL